MQLRFEPRVCPACATDDGRVLFRDVNRREGLSISAAVVECRECGLRYVSPAPSPADLHELYRTGFVDPVLPASAGSRGCDRDDRSLSGRVLGRINGALRGHPHDWPNEEGNGRSILDFGCHDGRKLGYWHHRGWHVAGIDLNQEGIAVASGLFPDGRFWCGDLLDLDISERFDAIRTDNVIEHLPNPAAYLAALVRLLKPRGRLRVFVPNGEALSVRLFGRYSAVFWMPFHLNLFSRRSLGSLLQHLGLADVECTTFTPIGSWTWTQRQALLPPGFNRAPVSRLDRALRRMTLVNYPGECVAQWIGLGEEVVATGVKA